MGCAPSTAGLEIIESSLEEVPQDANGSSEEEKVIKCWYYVNQATGERVRVKVRVTPDGKCIFDNGDDDGEIAEVIKKKAKRKCLLSNFCRLFKKRKSKDQLEPKSEVATPKETSPKSSKTSMAPNGPQNVKSVMLSPLKPPRTILEKPEELKNEKDILKELIDQGIIQPRPLEIISNAPRLESIEELKERELERKRSEDAHKKRAKKVWKREMKARKDLEKELKKKKKKKEKEQRRKEKKAKNERRSWLRLMSNENRDSASPLEDMKEKQRVAKETRTNMRRKRREEMLKCMQEIIDDFNDDSVEDEILFQAN